MIVEGQVHGGIAQGVGQALLERAVYDDAGQLITGSYMDYCMPRADDLPNFTVGMTCTPCTHNQSEQKGVGRRVRSDLLRSLMLDAIGETDMDMPATPERVWSMLNALMPVRRRRVMYDFNFHQPATVEAAINCYSESEDPIYWLGAR